MIRWLERNGYDVSYETGVDTDRYGSLIKKPPDVHVQRVTTSTGRASSAPTSRRARDAGVNLSFFSGNEVFWKTRWENDHRTLVCYKDDAQPEAPDGRSRPGVWTGVVARPGRRPPCRAA